MSKATRHKVKLKNRRKKEGRGAGGGREQATSYKDIVNFFKATMMVCVSMLRRDSISSKS